MIAKNTFIKDKILFLLTALAGTAGSYLFIRFLPGKTASVYLYFMFFSAVLFILNHISLARAVSGCGKCSEKITLEIDTDDVVHDPDEPVYEIIQKIQDLKEKKNRAETALSEQLKRKEYFSREFNQLLENIHGKKASFESVRSSHSEINRISLALQNLKESYHEFESYMSEVAGSHVDSISSLSGVIKSLVESIERESGIAARAEKISKEMSNTVRTGGEEITKTISLISEVEKFSLKINEIIAVIDNISEQTNLLAMNAAIEAAHAGDAGKGFSVVAGEIQKLSKETNQSSRKIADLVKSVSDTVKVMISNAQSASGGLKAIMDAVTRTERIIADITGAINEQSEGGNIIMHAAGGLYKSAETMKQSTDRNSGAIDKFSETLVNMNELSLSLGKDISKVQDKIDNTEKSVLALIDSVK